MVSLLWQADITGFDYRTLEDVALKEYDGDFLVQETMIGNDSFIGSASDEDSSLAKVQYSAIFLDEDSAGNSGGAESAAAGSGLRVVAGGVGAASTDQSAGGRVGPGSVPLSRETLHPETTLLLNKAFSLEQSDLNRSKEILQEDISLDMYNDTISLLAELLFQENEYREFNESVTIIEKVQTEFLKAGRLNSAGRILFELQEVNKLLADERPQWQERIRQALIMAGSRERLSYLAAALNRNPSISHDEVSTYLNHFGWEAVSAVTDLLGELEHRSHREAICDYLAKVGKGHVEIISKGIFDRRWFVVRNTVSILIQIGGDKAFSYLEKAIEHEDCRVRIQVARGLSEYDDEKNVGLLTRLVWDDDELVKQTALQSILECSSAEKLKAITEIINDDRFPSLGESDREKLIIALSELGGEHAVSYLTSLITGWRFPNSRANEFYPRVAFKALTNNMSEKAEKALLNLSRSWRTKIRRMARKALQQRQKARSNTSNGNRTN